MTTIKDLQDITDIVIVLGKKLVRQLAMSRREDVVREPKIYDGIGKNNNEYLVVDEADRPCPWLTKDGKWIDEQFVEEKVLAARAAGCYFASRQIAEDMIKAWCGEIPKNIRFLETQGKWRVFNIISGPQHYLCCGKWKSCDPCRHIEFTYPSRESAEHAYRLWVANRHIEKERTVTANCPPLDSPGFYPPDVKMIVNEEGCPPVEKPYVPLERRLDGRCRVDALEVGDVFKIQGGSGHFNNNSLWCVVEDDNATLAASDDVWVVDENTWRVRQWNPETMVYPIYKGAERRVVMGGPEVRDNASGWYIWRVANNRAEYLNALGRWDETGCFYKVEQEALDALDAYWKSIKRPGVE